MNNKIWHRGLAVAALALSIPSYLSAHRQWMLPSATVISSNNGWITVDAAVSNELFYFDHVPMRVTNLVITAPDGSKLEPHNVATGKYRTTFDVQLAQPGTYKIAQVSGTGFANWTENGVARNWRGNLADMSKEVPAGAENLKVSKMNNRVEIFVTAGKPSQKVLEPTGVGLELVPVSHPNDLVTGEDAKFQFLMDGKPASHLEVTVIPGGIRYRDALGEVKYKTDAEGKFSAKFTTAGMYWMNASVGAGGRGAGGPAGPGGLGGRMPMGDRSSYVAVLEVMTQ